MNEPKLRFHRNDGGEYPEWKESTIGNYMNVTSVKRVHQSDWRQSGVRFLRARDIVASFKGEKVADPLFISKELYDSFSAISGKVKVGDMLVTGVGTIGVPYLIVSNDPVYFKDGNIIWFQNDNSVNGKFLYYSFCSNYIQDYISLVAGIGTVGTYTIDNAKKTPFFVPIKEEQQKIADFLSAVDDKIDAVRKELEGWKTIKKGLLQQMFC